MPSCVHSASTFVASNQSSALDRRTSASLPVQTSAIMLDQDDDIVIVRALYNNDVPGKSTWATGCETSFWGLFGGYLGVLAYLGLLTSLRCLDDDIELNFQVGDLLVLDQLNPTADAEWCTCTLHGRRGLVPLSYVEVLDEMEAAAHKATMSTLC